MSRQLWITVKLTEAWLMADKVDFGNNAWLIAYDIADPRRLGRVHRLLKKCAMPVQYSVFLAWLGNHQLENLVAQLRDCIKSSEDDVRLYHLPASTELTRLGKQWLPDGVNLLHHGQSLQLDLKEDTLCRKG